MRKNAVEIENLRKVYRGKPGETQAAWAEDHPRSWNISTGEVFTAPIEYLISGNIEVDGRAYYGPPKQSFSLKIREGRVMNIPDLDLSD